MELIPLGRKTTSLKDILHWCCRNSLPHSEDTISAEHIWSITLDTKSFFFFFQEERIKNHWKKTQVVAGVSYKDNPLSTEYWVVRIAFVVSQSKKDFQTSKMGVLFFIIKIFFIFCSSLSVYFKDFIVLLFIRYSGKAIMDWPLISKWLYCVIWEDSENQTQQSEAAGWNRCCRKL